MKKTLFLIFILFINSCSMLYKYGEWAADNANTTPILEKVSFTSYNVFQNSLVFLSNNTFSSNDSNFTYYTYNIDNKQIQHYTMDFPFSNVHVTSSDEKIHITNNFVASGSKFQLVLDKTVLYFDSSLNTTNIFTPAFSYYGNIFYAVVSNDIWTASKKDRSFEIYKNGTLVNSATYSNTNDIIVNEGKISGLAILNNKAYVLIKYEESQSFGLTNIGFTLLTPNSTSMDKIDLSTVFPDIHYKSGAEDYNDLIFMGNQDRSGRFFIVNASYANSKITVKDDINNTQSVFEFNINKNSIAKIKKMGFFQDNCFYIRSDYAYIYDANNKRFLPLPSNFTPYGYSDMYVDMSEIIGLDPKNKHIYIDFADFRGDWSWDYIDHPYYKVVSYAY